MPSKSELFSFYSPFVVATEELYHIFKVLARRKLLFCGSAAGNKEKPPRKAVFIYCADMPLFAGG
jgi:hypothetical protein